MALKKQQRETRTVWLLLYTRLLRRKRYWLKHIEISAGDLRLIGQVAGLRSFVKERKEFLP